MKTPSANHPRTSAALFVTVGLILISFTLMTTAASGQYDPLKWLLSLGLFYAAGFFLQPAKMLIQHPDTAGEPFDQRKIEAHVKRHGAEGLSGWFEFDPMRKTLFLWKDGRAAPASCASVESFVHDTGLFRPISNNLASLHLLAAIFFNPLLGITMHKRDWKLFDFALAVFLCLALTRILKERTRPRYNLVMLNSNGQPAKRAAEMNAHVIDQALKLWPTAVFLCLLTMAFVLNNAKGLWKSQLVLFDLIEATLACFCASGVCAAILLGILELFWKVTGKIPTQAYLVVSVALFIGFATTPMIQKLVVPFKYSSEDSGERDPSSSKDMQTCCKLPTLGAYTTSRP